MADINRSFLADKMSDQDDRGEKLPEIKQRGKKKSGEEVEVQSEVTRRLLRSKSKEMADDSSASSPYRETTAPIDNADIDTMADEELAEQDDGYVKAAFNKVLNVVEGIVNLLTL